MLNTEQIKTIDNFCKDQGIQFYDLRKEMIDHISSLIEAKMAEPAQVNLEYELPLLALTLDLSGFHKTLAEKEELMERGIKKRQRTLWLNYLKWPKIIVAIALICALMLPFYYLGLSTKDHIGFNIVVLGVVLVWTFWERRSMKKPREPLLMLQSLSHYVPSAYWLGGFIFFMRLFSNYTGQGWTNTVTFALFITLITVTTILLSGAEIGIFRKINLNAKQNYPEIFAQS